MRKIVRDVKCIQFCGDRDKDGMNLEGSEWLKNNKTHYNSGFAIFNS
jgi:hypothetical protein